VKFLCDEMLKRLGQWLRVAGYDVLVLADGTDDNELLRRARDEGRVLLTRDRHIAEQHAVACELVLLEANDLEDCVDALQRQVDVDWLKAPFTRCMRCNTRLQQATAAQRREVPAAALARASAVRYCPCCGQLFWDGSHVEAMRRRLAAWQTRRQRSA
jgi:uncharacterized protein with PIN domain